MSNAWKEWTQEITPDENYALGRVLAKVHELQGQTWRPDDPAPWVSSVAGCVSPRTIRAAINHAAIDLAHKLQISAKDVAEQAKKLIVVHGRRIFP